MGIRYAKTITMSPLYLGESGENSNVWFRDAIRLLEDNNIGWAWWPMKKIESVAGPLSVIKTPEYQSLLDYWNNGGTAPTAAFGKSTLMQITENLKIENCVYQKDVIDAMFRQVYSDETIPFSVQDIPGVVYSTDYSMGVLGQAYYDTEVANYQVSTGTFTSWNTGWAYRNDGVDIEKCSDTVNSNGYNVGWTEAGEWIQYDVNVDTTAVYDVLVRVASANSNGKFHLSANGAAITGQTSVASTGGWQNWQTVTIPNVILTPNNTKLKFHFDATGFNLNSFEFVQTTTPISAIPALFQEASTIDEHTVQLAINKSFDAATFSAAPSNFEIFADGTSIPITAISVDANNPRIVYFTVNYLMKYSETLKISYNGSQVMTTDGTTLSNFTLEDVLNNLSIYNNIPGKLEAEAYFFQSGIQTENTTDAGGGLNIGFLDPTDYADYRIDVAASTTYEVDFRNASQGGSGSIELQLIDDLGNATTLLTQNFTSTGGWQSWTTNTASIQLPQGQHILRLVILQGPFNLNWMDFSWMTPTKEPLEGENIQIFPNPTQEKWKVQSKNGNQILSIHLFDSMGKEVQHLIPNASEVSIDASQLAVGLYFAQISTAEGVLSAKLIKY